MALSILKNTITIISRNEISKTEQINFLQTLGELLKEGFSLKSSLDYLEIITHKSDWITQVIEDVSTGKRLDETLQKHKFPAWITSQIYLSYYHGLLDNTLLAVSEQLKNENKQKEELGRLLQYPSILLLMMLGMLFGMRIFLLPQAESMIDKDNMIGIFTMGIIHYAPYLLLSIILIVFLVYLGVKRYFENKSAIAEVEFLIRFPIIKSFLKDYYTFRFTQEWSALLKSGLNMQDIVRIMQEDSMTPLMQDIGKKMEDKLKEGESLGKIMQEFSFLKKECYFIIIYGETTGALSKHLEIYSQQVIYHLHMRLEKMFQWIQPVLFIIIALLVVLTYMAMLLPMFDILNSL